MQSERPERSGGDGDLVSRIRGRDEDALALAYDLHADAVYGSLVRFLGDRESAEDVVQETYLALWQRAHQFDPRAGSLLGWLLGIARHKAIDRFRAASRRPKIVAPWTDRGDGSSREAAALVAGRTVGTATADDDPEDAAAREWTRSVVRTALSTMPDLERQVLQLAYDRGLSQSEIAARLGWPLGTVKTRTRRALASMREALDDVPDLRPTAAGREQGSHGSR
ncbi:MAG: sigma-70 family RNA polymerase sigma factor [Chloroflexi bacterium]|nr:sigma-70 family RNA polymerase sigma factor [Chloroflexota bacterium]